MKKLTIIIVAVFIFAFVSGVAFARLTSVQKILNDVWDTSDSTLQVELTL